MKRPALIICAACWVACLLACGGAGSGSAGSTTGEASSGTKEPPKKSVRVRWDERCAYMRPAHKEKLEADLEKAEADVTTKTKDYKKSIAAIPYPQQVEKKKAMEAAVAVRDKIKADIAAIDEWEPMDMPEDFVNGLVGKFGDGKGHTPVFRVLQVIDDRHVLLQHAERTYWFDMDTSGMRDGRELTLTAVVECTGTHTYTTPLGSTNTVRAFRFP
ncbi:MAG: hypothetical protein K2P78_14645 [Gemmataceae bacterium]|nr:hypothetical protein [Gemmataceae bacterium]